MNSPGDVPGHPSALSSRSQDPGRRDGAPGSSTSPSRSRAWSQKFPLWLHLAWVETRSHPAFTFGFVLNVCLGLLGFLTLDAFKTSIENQLSAKSQAAIGADISVWASRLITDQEYERIKSAVPPGARIRRETSLLSMATAVPQIPPAPGATAPLTRLVEIRAIDQDYPYYGELVLKNQGKITSTTPKDIVRDPKPQVWIGPELVVQMGLQKGDGLKLGQRTFTITDTVDYDPTAMPSGLAFAPRVFVGQDFLQETGLVGMGSRLWQAVMIAVPAPGTPQKNGSVDVVGSDLSHNQEDLSRWVKGIRTALGTGDLRVRSHFAAANDRNRALVYLNDYLGLVALVSLFLAAVGGSFLFQSFLSRRATAIGTLSALGLKRLECRLVYASQLLILGVMATAFTVVLSLGVLPALPWILQGILPEGIRPTLHGGSTLLALLLATGGNLIVCLPLLYRLGLIQGSRLFQEGQGGGLAYRMGSKDFLTWLPALVLFWLLAVFQAHSLKVGSLFIGIFAVSLGIFAGVGLLFLRLVGLMKLRGRFLSFDLALLSLVRHPTATVASFVAIALGSLLVNIVPAIKQLVEAELESPQGQKPPSLFLIDIQDEQKDRLLERVPAITGGVPLNKLAPFIRARLVAINGDSSRVKAQADDKSYSTREDEESERFINRGYNLSYRGHLLSSESVVEGRFFAPRTEGAAAPSSRTDGQPPAGTEAKTPEISLEERFAERLGLQINDTLAFDIEGVTIEGRVTSLRKVKWSSFDPNFFVIFEPGVLEEAPKTYIATIPALTTEKKALTEMEIVKEFPNISMIDISATAERVLVLANQMSQALSLMAALTLISGLAVLFAIAQHQAQKRMIEITLLKVMGTSFGTIRLNSLIEFGFLGFLAAAWGSLLSLAAFYLLARQVFETQASADLGTPLLLTVVLGLTCTVTGYLALRRILRSRPALLLGEALFDKA